MGLGINLYMKTLKYMAFMFALFTLISIPSLLIYNQGGNLYEDHHVGIQKYFATKTLGNLGSPKEIMTNAVEVPNTRNLATYVNIACQDDRKVLTDVVDFGLAYKNYSAVGSGMNITVRTIDKCSYGMMTDVSTDYNLDKSFLNTCLGRQNCTFLLDFDKIFD